MRDNNPNEYFRILYSRPHKIFNKIGFNNFLIIYWKILNNHKKLILSKPYSHFILKQSYFFGQLFQFAPAKRTGCWARFLLKMISWQSFSHVCFYQTSFIQYLEMNYFFKQLFRKEILVSIHVWFGKAHREISHSVILKAIKKIFKF